MAVRKTISPLLLLCSLVLGGCGEKEPAKAAPPEVGIVILKTESGFE